MTSPVAPNAPPVSERRADQLKHRLHWVCPSPSPYNAQLFSALAADPELDLTVHYGAWLSEGRPWRSNLETGYRARCYHRVAGVDWRLLQLALQDRRAFFVISGWDHATAVALLSLLGLAGRRFVVWTDTPDLARKRNPLFAFLRSRWLRWVFSRAYKVMGTGQPGLDALQDMGADQRKLVNFPYFVDITTCSPCGNRRGSKNRSPIRFISCGRLIISLKGHDIALRALAKAKRTTGVEFEYSIAGTGPDEEALKRLANQLGISAQVEFLGWVEPDRLTECLERAHVLIHPSPAHEPYGVAVLEAMAKGLPVLASDATCAALDRVRHGVNGFIHRAGDEDTLAAHIAFFLSNPAEIAQMGGKARETAEEWPTERGIQIIRRLVRDSQQDRCLPEGVRAAQ